MEKLGVYAGSFKMSVWRLCLSLIIALSVTSCSKDDAPKNLVLTGGTQTVQTVYADQTTGTGGIRFTAATEWTATVTDATGTKAGGSSVEWLTLSAYSGGAGDHTLTLTLTENRTGKDRKAKIEIVCGGDAITVTVEQKGTTEAGEAPVQQGQKLARIEYTNTDSENPDYYDKFILTFAYNADGKLAEMHDISYRGDEQAYYSDDQYTFAYEEGGLWIERSESGDYAGDSRRYYAALNEQGHIALLYQESDYSNEAWKFSYDADGYLQQITSGYYEPDDGNDDESDDNVMVPDIPKYDVRSFDNVKLNLNWQNGNLMSTSGGWNGETLMEWTYTSHSNNTPGLDFNVLTARTLFGNTTDTYTDLANLLYGLRMLGNNSKNLVKVDLVNWAYEAGSSDSDTDAPQPVIGTEHNDWWAPFEYSFTSDSYLSRVTARCTRETRTFEIATGETVSESVSYYDDAYVFTYE